MAQKLERNIGFIGGGNMAKAICEGMVNSGIANYSQIHASVAHEESKVWWMQKGAHAYTDSLQIVLNAKVIVLAIKPHMLKEAIEKIETAFPQKTKADNLERILFISILAGTKLEVLRNVLKKFFPNCSIIRVMPNTPLMVKEGCISITAEESCTPNEINIVKTIFSSSAQICQELPERLVNAFGALAGSGPAYVYLIIEALADAGVKQGLPRDFAMKSAAQTLIGSAKMVLETGKHPGQLKDEVCSPGGTTICGMHALEKAGVRSAMMDAVEAAAKRTAELEQLQASAKK